VVYATTSDEYNWGEIGITMAYFEWIKSHYGSLIVIPPYNSATAFWAFINDASDFPATGILDYLNLRPPIST